MANDFFNDPSCKALWRFEPGALTVDSKGGNILIPLNEPTEDLVNFKEGTGAVLYDKLSNQRHYILDTNLDAGFPTKSGDVVKKISLCCWFKPNTINSYCVIAGKKDWTNSKVSLSLCIRDNGKIFVSWGYKAGQYERYLDGPTLVASHNYHATVVADGVIKTCHLRVFDETANTVTNYNTTFAESLYITDAAWAIGGSYEGSDPYNGLVDEVVVFNRLLSDDEIDAIRTATFPPPPLLKVSQVETQIEWEDPPLLKVGQIIAQVEYSPFKAGFKAGMFLVF
jgi:hypothetical protein